MQAEHAEKLTMASMGPHGPCASLLTRAGMLLIDHSEFHRWSKRWRRLGMTGFFPGDIGLYLHSEEYPFKHEPGGTGTL